MSNSDSDSKERLKLFAAAAGLFASLLLAAWLLGYFDGGDALSDDPQVADLLRAMNEPDRYDAEVLKARYMQLTPRQQQEFARGKMLMSLPEQERKFREFFAQSEAEQRRQIDREIDEKVAYMQNAMAGGRNNRGKERKTEGMGKGPLGGKSAEGIMSQKQTWTAHASPELRSMMERRLQLMNERLKERGLDSL